MERGTGSTTEYSLLHADRQPIPESVLIGLLMLLALVTRLMVAWPALTGAWGFRFGDDGDYHALATTLLQTGLLGFDGHPSAYRMPMYPLFLAGIYWLSGASPTSGYMATILLSSINIALTYAMGRHIGGRAVAMIAALIGILDLEQLTFATLLMTETLCLLLMNMSAIGLTKVRQTSSWYWSVFTGLLIGMTVLTRVNMLILLPVAVIWLVRCMSGPWRARLARIALIVLLVGVCWAGWIGRNYLTFGRFIPLTTQSGNGYYGVFNEELYATQFAHHYGEWGNPSLSAAILAMDEFEADQTQRALALEWIRAHPQESAKLAVVQVYHFWRSDNNPLYIPVLLAALIGLVSAVRMRVPEAWLWLGWSISLSGLALISIAVPRFHIPLLAGIDTFAAIAIAQGGRTLSRFIHSRRLR